MKITQQITVAAFLAAGTAFANASSIILDSKLSKTDGSEAVSAWDYACDSGNFRPYINVGITFFSPTDESVIFGSAQNALGNHLFTGNSEKTLELSSLYVSSGETSGVSKIRINSLSVLLYLDSTTASAIAQIKDSSGNVVATSDLITYSTMMYDVYEMWTTATANFSANAVLNLSETYTVNFYTADGESDVYMSQLILITSSDYAIGDGTYTSIIRISATAIPEPSAFGLIAGLGALALAGTRRRKKA